MRVKVNDAKCEGHQLCVRLLPQIFLLDKAGYTYTNEGQDVPRELEDLVRQAIKNCPEHAISLVR